jgi:hypothetical protein
VALPLDMVYLRRRDRALAGSEIIGAIITMWLVVWRGTRSQLAMLAGRCVAIEALEDVQIVTEKLVEICSISGRGIDREVWLRTLVARAGMARYLAVAHRYGGEVKVKVAFPRHRLSFSPPCPVIAALGDEVSGGLFVVLQ